jgi:hypothetical protein
LEQFLREDTVVCPQASASSAVDLLCGFETVTGEQYADTPGVALASRVSGFGRAMGNVTREVAMQPQLVMYSKRSRASWNRRSRQPVDSATWRLRILEAEKFSLPAARLAAQRATSTATLAAWVRDHRHLAPADIDQGETTMALLILWEVDNQQAYPCSGALSDTAKLVGFARVLRARVAADADLSAWLQVKEVQRALVPGTAAVHQFRWSLRIVPPSGSQPRASRLV